MRTIIKNIKISINKRENILLTIVTNSLSSINTNMNTLSNLTFDINTKIANLYKRENLYQSKNKSNDTMSIFNNTMPATSTNNFENNANLNNTKSVATLFFPKITFLSTDNVTREKLENHEVIIANFKYEGEFPNDLKLQLKYFSCAEGFSFNTVNITSEHLSNNSTIKVPITLLFPGNVFPSRKNNFNINAKFKNINSNCISELFTIPFIMNSNSISQNIISNSRSDIPYTDEQKYYSI